MVFFFSVNVFLIIFNNKGRVIFILFFYMVGDNGVRLGIETIIFKIWFLII